MNGAALVRDGGMYWGTDGEGSVLLLLITGRIAQVASLRSGRENIPPVMCRDVCFYCFFLSFSQNSWQYSIVVKGVQGTKMNLSDYHRSKFKYSRHAHHFLNQGCAMLNLTLMRL